MTEKQKRLILIGGTVLAILIILLWFRKHGTGTNSVTNNAGAVIPDFNVSIPALNLPPHTGFPISIPGLPGGSTYEFQAISPCMCNGSYTSPSSSGSGTTLVFNQGDAGPNIYNYNFAQQSTGYNGAFYQWNVGGGPF